MSEETSKIPAHAETLAWLGERRHVRRDCDDRIFRVAGLSLSGDALIVTDRASGVRELKLRELAVTQPKYDPYDAYRMTVSRDPCADCGGRAWTSQNIAGDVLGSHCDQCTELGVRWAGLTVGEAKVAERVRRELPLRHPDFDLVCDIDDELIKAWVAGLAGSYQVKRRSDVILAWFNLCFELDLDYRAALASAKKLAPDA